MRCILLLLLIIATNSFAQKQKPEYYIYTKDWKPAKNVASADYVVHSVIIGDSLYVNRIFKGTGRLWKQESFKDAEQTIPHGQFAWYDSEGRIDSSGYVTDRKKSGTWAYYNDTLGIYLSLTYANGKEVERRDYVNKIVSTLEGSKSFDEEKRERDSATQGGTGIKTDDKEAVFKGGAAGYKKYLQKQLDPPKNLLETGTVKLQFLINKVGKVQDLLIHQSIQLSADVEALRVLSEMPEWTPAYQNGKNVIYQAIQYITFDVL